MLKTPITPSKTIDVDNLIEEINNKLKSKSFLTFLQVEPLLNQTT